MSNTETPSLPEKSFQYKHDLHHGPLDKYVKLRVAHAPGMPGTFSPPPRVSDADMYRGTCVTHVPWCMPGSLTCSFFWSQWREKRSRPSRRMRNPQRYVSGKRPMERKLLLPFYSPCSRAGVHVSIQSMHNCASTSKTLCSRTYMQKPP